MFLFGVAVDLLERKLRCAYGYVLGPTGPWTTVAHPLTTPSHDRLAGTDIDYSALILNSNHTIEY
jgi:hypothetical protein